MTKLESAALVNLRAASVEARSWRPIDEAGREYAETVIAWYERAIAALSSGSARVERSVSGDVVHLPDGAQVVVPVRKRVAA